MQQTLQLLHEIVWGPWTMLLFLGTGLFFTVKSGGFQIRKLPYWWKKTMGSLGNGSVSSFQTSCTALAATVAEQWAAYQANPTGTEVPLPRSGWRVAVRPYGVYGAGAGLPKHGTALCAVCGTGFFGDGKHGAGECGK